jgi:hypothetical protein
LPTFGSTPVVVCNCGFAECVDDVFVVDVVDESGFVEGVMGTITIPEG